MQEQLKAHKTVEQIARKHRLDVSFIANQLKMGVPIEHEHTKNNVVAMDIALQHLDEIPDYYTRLKKMELDAKKHHRKFKDVKEETKSGDEGLHDWFNKSKSSDGKKGWVQLGGKHAGKPCARQPGQTSTPKCGSSKMKGTLSKKEEESARIRKNFLDPNQPEKTGGAKPTNVRTEDMDLQEVKDKPGKGSGKKDACYHKVKSRYDVWPSAYASGALTKCRKVGASNWGTKSEDCWDGYEQKGMKKKGKKTVPNCVSVKEEKDQEKYCQLCKKNETKSECSFGPSLWEKYSIAKVHPTNEAKDYEYQMARNELQTAKRAIDKLMGKLKGEGNIEAWVQSKITKAADYLDSASDYMQGDREEIEEDSNIMKYNEYGQTYVIRFAWRGLMYKVQIFIPSLRKPTAQDIKKQLEKIYPGAQLMYFEPKAYDPVDPTILLAKEEVKKYYKPNKSKVLKLSWERRKAANEKAVEDMKSMSGYQSMADAARKKMEEEVEIQEVAAWQRKEGKNPSGGLNKKGIESYRRENPGSKLSMAVTTPPSKLKPGSKSANRRKSFCARMGGVEGPMKDEKGRPTRKALALKKWNC